MFGGMRPSPSTMSVVVVVVGVGELRLDYERVRDRGLVRRDEEEAPQQWIQ